MKHIIIVLLVTGCSRACPEPKAPPTEPAAPSASLDAPCRKLLVAASMVPSWQHPIPGDLPGPTAQAIRDQSLTEARGKWERSAALARRVVSDDHILAALRDQYAAALEAVAAEDEPTIATLSDLAARLVAHEQAENSGGTIREGVLP